MKRVVGVILVSLAIAAPALAQTAAEPAGQPNSTNVAQQFKTGANHVGDGAAQIGEGIEQGAILSWHAVEAGAASTVATFKGEKSSAPNN